VLTPGAVAKIRDSGTFYHCIVNNPSAVEWGIFWLRQASALGTLWTFNEKAEKGVWTLVDRLEKNLQKVHHETGRGSIRKSQEVLQIEPAKRPTEVVLRVIEHGQSEDRREPYSLRTDHVILALPQWPLQRLQEHFPREVTQRIDGVEPLPLLKAFVVTKKPWWQPHLEAQSYAWLVPTRELHFYRGEKQTCPSLEKMEGNKQPPACNCGVADNGPGMIMLYTDQPGIRYWDLLTPRDKRASVLWRDPKSRPPLNPEREVSLHRFELLDLLIRRLLLIHQPGLAYRINNQRREFFKYADQLAGSSELSPQDAASLAKLLQQLGKRETQPGHGHLLAFSQSIFEFSRDDTRNRDLVGRILVRFIPTLPEKWFDYLTTALEARQQNILPADVDEAAKSVVAYGIRDWSAEPFGGAAHLWKPGFSAAPVKTGRLIKDPLIAFSLRERAGGPRNIHICGEAFSGNQGFIEGALQTAEQVVGQIIGKDALKEVIDVNLKPLDKGSAATYDKDHLAQLAAVQAKRFRLIEKMPKAL
jgi:hypothetical protein